jgi:hypothetical protein
MTHRDAIGRSRTHASNSWFLSSAIAVSLAACLVASPVSAAPSWLPPANVSGVERTAEFPQIAVDSQGNATAIWRRWSGEKPIAKSAGRRVGGFEVQQADTAGFLRLGKQRGYEIALYMPNDRVVLFYAFHSKRSRNESFKVSYSIYAARNLGDLAQGLVRARFGSLGRVALRFRQSGRMTKDDPQPGCEGGSETTEEGRFVGHLRFRGEGDYFHVSSAKGKAYIVRSPRLRCKKGQATEPHHKSLRRYVAPSPLFSDRNSIALLYSSTRTQGRYVGITAMHAEGSPPGADVELGIVEPRHGMAIGHGVSLNGPAGTLLTSLPGVHPATATLAPPAPFYGKAAYSEESGAWTGTLGVKLPGLNLPLTGPDFNVHLCVSPLKDRDGCDFFKAESPSYRRLAWPGRASR